MFIHGDGTRSVIIWQIIVCLSANWYLVTQHYKLVHTIIYASISSFPYQHTIFFCKNRTLNSYIFQFLYNGNTSYWRYLMQGWYIVVDFAEYTQGPRSRGRQESATPRTNGEVSTILHLYSYNSPVRKRPDCNIVLFCGSHFLQRDLSIYYSFVYRLHLYSIIRLVRTQI